jgi:hypothetical protein
MRRILSPPPYVPRQILISSEHVGKEHDERLNGASLDYTLRCVIVLFATAFSLFYAANAQTLGTVYGVVVDASSKQPVPQVNVTVQGEKRGTTTDDRGAYHFNLEPRARVLRFSHIGYLTQSVSITVVAKESLRVDVGLSSTTVPLGEVTVLADSLPISSVQSLGAIAFLPIMLQNVSGVFGDIGRTMQAMAGVTSNNEVSGRFNVRGGTMFENLLLLGGVELIEPYHLKESPNTSLGIVNVDLLERVLFVPGGFTARYGDRLSAIVDMKPREGSKEKIGIQAGFSLADMMAVAEAPLCRNSSVLLSFRSSYSDYVARYLTDQNQRWPSFYDASGLLGFQLSHAHHLAVQLLHAEDKARGLSDGEYSTSLIGVQSTYTLSARTSVRSELSFSRQYENLARSAGLILDDAVNWSRDSSGIILAEARVDVDSRINDYYSLTAGARLQRCQYDGFRSEVRRIEGADTRSQGSMDRSASKSALYVENILQLTPTFLVNAGLRWDAFSLTSEIKLAPRVLLSYQPNEHTALKAAWGLYYQTPTYNQLLAASQAGEQPQRMQRAVHYVVGIERNLKDGMRLRAEAYFKQLDALISFDRLRSGDLVYSPRNDSRGEIKGLDVEASFRDERAMGWFSFAWMQAKEVNDTPGAQWHFRPTDQRITINFVFEPRIAERWVLSLRSYYGSGFSYVNDLPGTQRYVFNHYPDYKRLDLRVSYSFRTGPLRSTAFVEITNLFSMRNVRSFKGILQDPSTPDYNLFLPMIINVGLRFKY